MCVCLFVVAESLCSDRCSLFFVSLSRRVCTYGACGVASGKVCLMRAVWSVLLVRFNTHTLERAVRDNNLLTFVFDAYTHRLPECGQE